MGKKKIVLSQKDRELPAYVLAKKYKITPVTAYKARKRGWFFVGYHSKKFDRKTDPLPVGRKSKFKKLIYLTEEDRRLTLGDIARKFNIGTTTARSARDNGWIAQKLGSSVNCIDGGVLPDNVFVEDLIRDAKKGAKRVRRVFDFDCSELDDVCQEILVRLLETTADKNFVSEKWRQKFAYFSGLKYVTRKIYSHNSKFIYGLDIDYMYLKAKLKSLT